MNALFIGFDHCFINTFLAFWGRDFKHSKSWNQTELYHKIISHDDDKLVWIFTVYKKFNFGIMEEEKTLTLRPLVFRRDIKFHS